MKFLRHFLDFQIAAFSKILPKLSKKDIMLVFLNITGKKFICQKAKISSLFPEILKMDQITTNPKHEIIGIG